MSAFLDENGELITVSKNNPLPVDSGTSKADDGVILPLESLAKSFSYTDNNLTGITVSYNGETYVKTLTYVDNKLTTTSIWVKQ